jgi:acetoin utilization protein AcuB
MTDNVRFVEATATVGEAIEALGAGDVRHVPVLEGGRLVGILSDRDVRDWDVRLFSRSESAAALSRMLERPVTDLMHGDVVAVSPEDDASEVISQMLEARVGAVPVVEPHTRELVGIVSYVDVLRAVRDLV